jgi:hypothetical protein
VLVGGLLSLTLLSAMVGRALAEGATAGDRGGQAEAEFVRLANGERVQAGAPPVAVDASLSRVARWWAANMAAAGTIFHNHDLPAYAPENWLRLGENVGKGNDPVQLHRAFAASPTHYSNLVDPNFDSVGLGVAYDANDVLYVVFDFMERQPPPPPVRPAPAPVVAPKVAAVVHMPAATSSVAAAVAPRPPAVAPVLPVRSPGGLQAAIAQLRELDAVRRPPPSLDPKIGPAPAAWERAAGTPHPSHKSIDQATMVKAWLPPRDCERASWRDSLRDC